MTREEFQTERTRIISEMLDNPDEYGIYPTTKCFEQLDALFDSLSLPPAEGAEKSCLSCRFHNSPTYHDKMWCRDCQQLSHYEQQPTAEGAKEHKPTKSDYDFIDKYVIRDPEGVGTDVLFIDDVIAAMYEFATLHAQRIAEKMVEWISVKDKLPEEHEDVLCYNGHRISSHNWCKYTGQDDKWFKETFTHWGKLPKLPKS